MRPQTYGRRQGRPLRPAARQRLDTMMPRLKLSLPAADEELDPEKVFARAGAETWLEIGFGGGEHLARQVEANPEVCFLGAEFFVNGIASLLGHLEELEAARSQEIGNLRIHQGDALDLLAVLPPASLSRVFLLFPDPWPKTRHHKRRILRRETLGPLARAMKAGALLRVATDDADYLVWILRLLTSDPRFAWTARRADDWRRRPPDWPPTRYEAKAEAAGRIATFLEFERR